MDSPLQFIPLGGLGRIGMNGMLIGHRDRWILVDCGTQFASEWEIGAERRLFDLNAVDRFADRIEAVLITHGHEDHVGALPWVLPRLNDVPMYATPFTRELIKHRLSEHGMWTDDRVTTFTAGEAWTAGPFEVESVRVTHSLPDCVAFALRCEDGTIVHTGDWKIDEHPMDGDHFDRAAFERIGRDGVDVLLCDSTNALRPGWTVSERQVADKLLETIEGHSGRVVVTQFASNIHRLHGLVEAAEATGRRIAFAGNSLHKYLMCAQRTGRNPIDAGKIVSATHIADLAPEETLLITTGSQGESRAALSRAAEGHHPHLTLRKGDLVLHSARIIPGSEERVYSMFNHLARSGCEIIQGRDTGIHASGHARQDELAELYRLLSPRHLVPVHGEYTFLQGHANWGRGLGVPATSIVSNGEHVAVHVEDQGVELQRLAHDEPDIFYAAGPALGDGDTMRLSERKRLAWNGVIAMDVSLTAHQDGGWASKVEMKTAGVWIPHASTIEALKKRVVQAIEGCPAGTPLSEIEHLCKYTVRGYSRKTMGQKPEVMVFIHTEAGESA